jgi:hypothetical protein
MLLCIDFTGEKAKITCVENKRGEIRAVEALELDVSDLGDYLRSKSGKIKEIRVSAPVDKTFHKAFTLPNLKGRILKEAVKNEVIKAFGNSYQFEQQDLGETVVPGLKANRITMTAGIERKTLEELSQIFAGFSIKPSIFTTYPLTLQTLLEEMGFLSDEESLGFVEISHPRSRIVIFKGKETRLTRELPLAEGEKEPESSALAKDIYRTLLFYTESFPNEKVARIVIAGNSITSEISENLKQKAGVEILPFSPLPLFQGIEDSSRVYPGCLGLALINPARFSFKFIPFSVQEKGRIKKRVTLFSFIFLGMLLMFALFIFRLSWDLRDLNVHQVGIKGEIKMKEDRMKDLALELVSHSIETSQPNWSEILLELAAVVPSGVSLKSMTIKKAKNGWSGEVCGIAEGEDELSSLVLVEELQNNFFKSPLFTGTKVAEKKLEGENMSFKITYQLKS